MSLLNRALPLFLAGLALGACDGKPNPTAVPSASPSAGASAAPQPGASAAPAASPAATATGQVTLLVDGAAVPVDPTSLVDTSDPTTTAVNFGDVDKASVWSVNVGVRNQGTTFDIYSLAFKVTSASKGLGSIFLSSGNLPSSQITTTIVGDKVDFTFKGKLDSTIGTPASHTFDLTVKGLLFKRRP